MYLAVTVSKQNSEIETLRIFRKFLVLWVSETNVVLSAVANIED